MPSSACSMGRSLSLLFAYCTCGWIGRKLDKTMLVRIDHRMDSVPQSQLGQDGHDMDLGEREAHRHAIPDLPIAETLADKAEEFAEWAGD